MGIFRRKKRRNSYYHKTKVNFTAIIVIMSIAILFGYGTAKFIIYPIFNSDSIGSQDFKIEKFLSFFLDEENPQQNNGENGQNITGPGVEQDVPDSDSNIVEDQLKITQIEQTEQTMTPDTQNGYCIQFGSFSTKLSAESLVSELKTSGINADIIEKDDAYKVVSKLFEKKEQAVATMNSLVGTKYVDAFITQK